MNKQLLIIFLFFGLNLDVESKIDLNKIANEVKSKIQKAPAKATAIALGTIGAVAGIASIFLNKTKLEELIYFYDKLLDTISETNVKAKVNEFKLLSQAQRELRLGDVILFEIDKTQSKEDLKKNLVKITCKREQYKEKNDLYLDLSSNMIVQLKEGKPVPMNFAKDTEPKKTYIVKTLAELADPVDQKISHWSRNKTKYIVGGACLVLSASVVGYGIYDYKTGGYITAKIAEAARIKAADEAKKVFENMCSNKGATEVECENYHIKLIKLCPIGSTNDSCIDARKNLDKRLACKDPESTECRAQVCLTGTKEVCEKAKTGAEQNQHSRIDTTESRPPLNNFSPEDDADINRYNEYISKANTVCKTAGNEQKCLTLRKSIEKYACSVTSLRTFKKCEESRRLWRQTEEALRKSSIQLRIMDFFSRSLEASGINNLLK